MADLIIRNMEMPKTCCQCDLKIYDPEIRWNENGIEQIGAWICKRTREIIWNTQRGENCPLVPLPDGHGELIDRDAVKKHKWIAGVSSVVSVQAIDDAPTIVPAEGGEGDA